MRPGRLVAAALVLALALPCLAADRLVLQGGAVAEGVVLRETPEEVVLQQGDRELRIPRARILRMELDPAALVVDEALAARLGCEVIKDRVAAGDEILRTWPASRGTLDFALRHSQLSVRLEATHLLRRPQVTDFHDRVIQRLGDRESVVRMIALRVLRNRDIRDAEPRVIKLLREDPDGSVRMEATLALETVGTVACLDALLAQYERETEKSAKRRQLKILTKLTGEDAGEDAAAWQAAVDRAKERAARPQPARKPSDAAPPKDAAPATPGVTLRPLAPGVPGAPGTAEKQGPKSDPAKPAEGRGPAAPAPESETPPADQPPAK